MDNNFFYNLNKHLNAIRATPEVTHGQLNERDMSRAAKGYEKYGKAGMAALAQAGRNGKALDPVRKKYDRYDNESVEEGLGDMVRKVGSKVLDTLGHGSDADQIRDLQKRMGVPQTGMKPGAESNPKIVKKDFRSAIDDAKKEVDEMLGSVAAEAMKSALSGGQKKLDKNNNGKLDANDFAMLRNNGKKQMADEASQGNAFTAHKRPRAEVPNVGQVTHGAKHDTTEIPGGRRVTRRTDASGMSVGAQDDAPAAGEPRGRGRPKGPAKAAERVTANATKHKGGRKTMEGDMDAGEYDQEGEMAKDTIQTVVRHAKALEKILGDNDNLPEWVQSKLAKIEGMMTAVDDYMQNNSENSDESDNEQPIAEKAVSKKQQRFMGMAHAMQKDEKVKGASPELKKVAKTMKKSDTEDFASTKQKGLPEKSKKVKEAGGAETPTASSGFGYGKGIYDSMSRELENMIAESISINMSDSSEGSKSLTITATDEDAAKLAAVLKSSGMGASNAHGHEESYPSYEQAPCGDDQQVDENSPDYPTNQEVAQDNFGYSGGLNKPKSTGQTTVPVIASQDERQMSYESDMRRMREIAGIKEAKKEVEEEQTDEGNLFTGNLAKARAAGKKQADLDNDGSLEKVKESIFDLTNQWRAYKG